MPPLESIESTTSDLLVLSEISQHAWEELKINLPSVNGQGQVLLPFLGLRITCLPGWEKVALQPNDDWVILYEQLIEKAGKAQRKQGASQSGVFYTPVPVARYLTMRTLGAYLDRSLCDIRNNMALNRVSEAAALLQTVQNVRIMDPACGTGVFLTEALCSLIRFYQQTVQEFPALATQTQMSSILVHQMTGIDIDPLSVMIAELRLVQWAYRLLGSESSGFNQLLPQNGALQCADTLNDALDWNVPAWDFILGNPPYVSEVRKQTARFNQVKNTAYYQAKMDLCDAFIAWALEHLKPQGQLAFVLPEYWTQRTSTAALRVRLWQEGQIQELWTFEGDPLFKNAPGHHSSLLLWQKTNPPPSAQGQSTVLGVARELSMLTEDNLKPTRLSLDPVTTKLRYGSNGLITLLDRLSNLPPLLPKTSIQQGIVIPQGRLKKADHPRLSQQVQENLSVNAGVFLLKESEIESLSLNDIEKTLLKPYYLPTGFQPFTGFSGQPYAYQLIYGDAQTRKAIEAQPAAYPQIRKHLDQFCSINTSAFAPYGLHRPRQPIWFEDTKKIFCPRQVMTPAFAVVDFPAYVSEGFYIIRPDENPYYLCALLNSTLAWFWFYQHKRKGKRLQIDKDVLRIFPAPVALSETVSKTLKEQLIKLAHQLSGSGLNHAALQKLDKWVYQAYQLTAEEIGLVENARKAIG